MRTYPLTDDNGVMFAFEIDSPTWGFGSKLRRIDGVSDVRERRLFEDSDVHARFVFRDRECIAWEPFGDNSRWWIGPANTEPPHWSITDLERAFCEL